MTIQTATGRAAAPDVAPANESVPARSAERERASRASRASRGTIIASLMLAMTVAFAALSLAPATMPWSIDDPSIAWALSLVLAVGTLLLAAALSWSAAYRRGRAWRASRPASVADDSDGRPDDPEGLPSVAFRTEGARRRFVPLAATPAALRFSLPAGRMRQGASATVSIGALPETVTCGAGYLEVLWATSEGFVVNEVRTHGDKVTVTALPEPFASAEEFQASVAVE